MISVIGAVAQAIAGKFEPKVPVSLFYRAEGYSVGEISLDLILSEEHSLNAVVTEHPIQNGSSVADHVSILPQSGTFKALVSNYSISTAEADKDEDWMDTYRRAESRQASMPNRAQEAWIALKELERRREPITIVTVLEVYDNVILTGIRTTLDEETGDALEIEISYQQVKQVQLRETKVTAQVQPRNMKSNINQKSAVQVNSGQKVGTEATPQEEQQLELGEVSI